MKRWFLWEITIKKGRNLTFHYIPTCFHSHESLSRHDDNPCNNNPRDPRRHRVLYDLCDDTLFRNDLSYHDPAFVHNRDDLRCNINRPSIRDHSDNRHCVRSQNHNPHRRDPCIFLYSNFFHFVITMSILFYNGHSLRNFCLSFVIFIDNNCHRWMIILFSIIILIIIYIMFVMVAFVSFSIAIAVIIIDVITSIVFVNGIMITSIIFPYR